MSFLHKAFILFPLLIAGTSVLIMGISCVILTSFICTSDQECLIWYDICSTNDLLYRVGSTFPALAIACYDIHGNRAPFHTIPDVTVQLQAAKDLYFKVHGMKIGLSTDKMILKIMVSMLCTSSVLLIEK